MSRLPGEVDASRVLRPLARFGWTVESIKGSHFKLVHPRSGEKLTIAHHGVVRRPALKEILKAAGIGEDAFLEVF